jgi:hypothetical protein
MTGGRRTFRIVTAWIKDVPDESPWLLEAYDEIAEDNWNGVPDFFMDTLEKHKDAEVRIVNLYVDYAEIGALFEQADLPADIGRTTDP